MTDRTARSGRWPLALWMIAAIAPPSYAQILWGTASANASFPNGRLLRIDYATGTVQATFNGPSGAVIGDGFTGVAVRPSNGQVFVTDGAGTNNVYRFDPATGASLGSIGSPTGATSIDALEFNGNELWASTYFSSTIHRINPDTGALIGTPLTNSLSGFVEGGMTIANNQLYTRGGTGNTTIARRNLATGAVLGEFATPNGETIRGLATDGTSLFAASDTGVIYHLDFNGALIDSRAIGVPLDGLGGFTPVPEPAAIGLVVAVAVGVGYAWRRLRTSV